MLPFPPEPNAEQMDLGMGPMPGPPQGLGAMMGDQPQLPGLPQGGVLDLAGLDSMVGVEDFGGSIVPMAPDGVPIQLDGEDLRIFMFRFRAMLEGAIVNMAQIHEDAAKDRMFYKMQARDQEYEGQPNVTVPISANKTDGTIAHLRDAVEQRPLVSVSVEGVGKAAEEATEVAPLIEAMIEREINRSGSREVITGRSIRESCVVGSVLAVLSMATYEDGEQFAQIETIPIEDVFIDNINAHSLDATGFAYRKEYRFYELEEMARDGFIDREALEKIKGFKADKERSTEEEKDKKFHVDTSLQEDMALRTVYTGYMRYRALGTPAAELYQVIYHRRSLTPLAVRRNPYRAAFSGANAELMRVGKLSDSLLGRGIPRRLATQQEMADNAINNHLAVNNLAANPPYMYRSGSAFAKYLERVGRFGLRAGVGIPTLGEPQKGDVSVLEFPNNGLNLTDVNLANQFASQATYTEEAIGAPSAGRKTLGQFQVEVHKGTIRLRLDLSDYAYDASALLTKYYAMICAYKLIPAGIIEVGENGKLLGAYEVPADEVRETIQAGLIPMLLSGEIPPEEMAEVDEELWESLTHGKIPSGIRPDVTISLSGTKIIADKVAELEMLNQFSAYILTPGIMEAMANDDYVNYHVRDLGRKMGLTDIDKRIPKAPGRHMDPQARDAALAPFQQTFQRLSTI